MLWVITVLVQYHSWFIIDDGSCGFRVEKEQACLVLLALNPPAHKPFSRIDL